MNFQINNKSQHSLIPTFETLDKIKLKKHITNILEKKKKKKKKKLHRSSKECVRGCRKKEKKKKKNTGLTN